MASVCFYFHVHQPYRIRKYTIFDIGHNRDYFHSPNPNQNNEQIFNKVAEKCYIPTTTLLLKLLKKHPEFRVSFSITGVFLEQAKEFMPQLIDLFKEVVDTGRAELIGETYYHSLAFLYSQNEFLRQVRKHSNMIKKTFGYTPKVFRNTELIYRDDIGELANKLGYKGVIAEGADHILGWRNSNFVYHHPSNNGLKLLLKNYKLSDDIAFRFSNKGWEEYPLNIEKYGQWISQINGNGNLINLFMDYETFGEHQWEDTGIFDFIENLPSEILKHPDNDFVTPSEAITRYESHDSVSFPDFVSWADIERDLSAWRSNSMQKEALKKIYSFEKKVLNTKDPRLIEDWRRLQTSDHYYYMCTKWFSDGDVHKYFSPYESPYEAFINFSNVLNDLKLRVEEHDKKNQDKKRSKTKKAKNVKLKEVLQ